MRFKLGLAVGGALGWWVASRSNEEKRRDVDRLVQRVRSDPRFEQVRDVVSTTVSEVASTTSQAAGAGGPAPS